jgi:four helix bundle protein
MRGQFAIKCSAPPFQCLPTSRKGRGRGSDKDFRRFLWHSLGSANELEYDLLLARDLGFLPAPAHSRLTADVEEVRRMLSGLIQRLTG